LILPLKFDFKYSEKASNTLCQIVYKFKVFISNFSYMRLFLFIFDKELLKCFMEVLLSPLYFFNKAKVIIVFLLDSILCKIFL